MSLAERIKKRETLSAVIGCGYVGLPLAVEFGKVGLKVVGIDLSTEKVDAINRGESYIPDVSGHEVSALVKKGLLKATTDFSVLKDADTVNICVPTPLRKTKDPDVSYVVAAAEEIAKYLHKGQLLILESTTYPGTTDEILLPMFEAKGFKVGKDIFLAFSPERVDPGNPVYHTKNTPKVVGGVTPQCTRAAVALYSQSIDRVVPVSSTRVAEMIKLLENTFRSVNIGLVNEMALMCDRMGIDVWEVIDSAATKPFGFMPFYPGPGLGGHCIPIDPFYLSWKAKSFGFEARFIELAGQVNGSMPSFVVSKIGDALNEQGKCIKGSKILVLGVAYKKDIDDIRESPALDVMGLLQGKGAKVDYYDPYIPRFDEHGIRMTGLKKLDGACAKYDCTVILANHSNIDYKRVVEESYCVLDTRNALKGVKNKKVVRL